MAFIETQQKSDSISVSHENTTTPVSEKSRPGDSRNSKSSDRENIISKYLISPVANTPCTRKRAPRARPLTNADSLAELEENERKKCEEQEIKNRRNEKEKKKKKREIEIKQKAEERAKKEKERAMKKARIEEERLRKAEMKAKKS